jgi:hypothetical protein
MEFAQRNFPNHVDELIRFTLSPLLDFALLKIPPRPGNRNTRDALANWTEARRLCIATRCGALALDVQFMFQFAQPPAFYADSPIPKQQRNGDDRGTVGKLSAN